MDFLTKLLPKIFELDLEFELDIDAKQRKMFVAVYMVFADGKIKVNAIEKFLNYGQTIKHKGKTFSASVENLQILFALNSLGTSSGQDGLLAYPLSAPILQYLRTKPNVKETDTAKKVAVYNEALTPAVKIDYDQKQGITITAGYRTAGSDRIIPATSIEVTDDGEYLWAENGFYLPLPGLDPDVKKILDKQKINIPAEQTVRFLAKEMKDISSKFTVVLSEELSKIKIVEEKFKPRVKIDITDSGTLEITVDYLIGGNTIAHSFLKDNANEYIQLDAYSWVCVPRDIVDKTTNFYKELSAQEKEGKFYLAVPKYGRILQYVQQVGGVEEKTPRMEEYLKGTRKQDAHDAAGPTQRPSFDPTIFSAMRESLRKIKEEPAKPSDTAQPHEGPKEDNKNISAGQEKAAPKEPPPADSEKSQATPQDKDGSNDSTGGQNPVKPGEDSSEKEQPSGEGENT